MEERIAFSSSCLIEGDGILCKRYDRNEKFIDSKKVMEVRSGGKDIDCSVRWGTKYIEVSLGRGSCFWNKDSEGKDILECDTQKFRE